MDLLRRFLFISLALGLCTVTARAQGPDVDKVSDTPLALDQKDSGDNIPINEASQSVDSTQASENNVTVEQPASTTVEPTVSTVPPTDPETTTEAVTPPDTTTGKETTVKTTNVKTTHPPIVTIPKPPQVPPETTYVER